MPSFQSPVPISGRPCAPFVSERSSARQQCSYTSALVPAGAGEDLLVAGQTRLMGAQAITDVERLRELFEAFARKRDILQLLERTLHAEGVKIFIGEETGIAPLEDVALVAAPYGRDGEVLGVLGVIGPTRMAYDRVIPVVQATAQALGAAISTR